MTTRALPPAAPTADLLHTAEIALVSGRLRDAVDHASQALDHAREHGDLASEQLAIGQLATLCALNAEYRRSGALLAEAEELLSRLDETERTDPRRRYPLLVADALLAAAAFDALRCRRVADAFAEHPELPVWSASADLIGAMGDYLEGQRATAKARLSSVLGSSRRVGVLEIVEGFCFGLLADILIAEGAPKRALGIVDQLPPTLGDHVLCFAMQRTSALLALGRNVEVIATTEPCIQLGPTHCMRTFPPLLLRRAIAFTRLGRFAEADSELAEAIALIEHGDSRVPYMTVPRDEFLAALAGLRERQPQVRGIEAAEGALGAVPAPTPTLSISLTKTERLIAHDLTADATLDEIARRRHLSVNTVKFHTRSIYRKLGVGDRASAVSLLTAQGDLLAE